MVDRALLVGINAYPGQPLNGCVNDVTDMAQFLVQALNFDQDGVRLLVDARATAQAIMDRLDWLVAGAAMGDRLFFHYSGHGTQFPMRDATGAVTAQHDSICPVDFDWTREHAILDDDLRAVIDRVPDGVEFIFVSDSCNSGDLTRAFRRWRPRFLVPPADIAWRSATAAKKNLMATPIAHDRCGLISGCRSDQESADAVFGGRYNGALTYFLLQTLSGPGGLTLPLTTLVADVVSVLNTNSYPQTPQLRGPAGIINAPFF
ncbi:MAG: caspase family protein [Proteobacteria bacterium]|nr:caspase family protein [Pseudomonadota bacterium]